MCADCTLVTMGYLGNHSMTGSEPVSNLPSGISPERGNWRVLIGGLFIDSATKAMRFPVMMLLQPFRPTPQTCSMTNIYARCCCCSAICASVGLHCQKAEIAVIQQAIAWIWLRS